MSRMFDRLMLSDDIRPERRAQIEKAACIITADECARYFMETREEGAEQCFINMAPPFAEPFWIEYRATSMPIKAFATGALVVPTDYGVGESPRWSLRFHHFDETEKGSFKARGVLNFHVGGDGSVLPGEMNEREMIDLSVSADSMKDFEKRIPKTSRELIAEFQSRSEAARYFGIMLHDKIMNDEAFQALEGFIAYLKDQKILIRNMRQIADSIRPNPQS